MIFSEIYGSYFNAVAKIISLACEGELDNKSIYEIVEEKGFAESSLNIPSALKNEWYLLEENNETPILSAPKMPLTTLEKRWLKAILLDKRVKLFGVDDKGLEDVEPLFTPDTFVYYDRYTDGDDFESREYIRNFKTILEAIHSEKSLCLHYETRNADVIKFYRTPYKIEYSAKDDKFRLLTINRVTGNINTYNLQHLNYCSIVEKENDDKTPQDLTDIAEIIITDERNALERVMLSFSHLQKESRQLDDKHYSLKLYYDKNDETELLIRLLSFGPRVKLLSPDSLLSQMKKRIFNQEVAS